MQFSFNEASLILALLPGFGPKSWLKVYRVLGRDVGQIFQMSGAEIKQEFGLSSNIVHSLLNWHKSVDLKGEQRRMESLGVQFFPRGSDDYPPLLQAISDPPIGIFHRGQKSLHSRAVAIVGSRECTIYGEEIAQRFAYELAEQGVLIVSGLARGVDLASHRGAIQAPGGETVAVLGCGVNIVYPSDHKAAYNKILERGCLISEYSCGVEVHRANFPQRNRIISGLSQALIVVESGVNGGSLISAHCAAKENRPVYAVPGRITQPYSEGCHKLIREGKAKLISSTQQILDLLESVPNASRGQKSSSKRLQKNATGYEKKASILPDSLSESQRTICEYLQHSGEIQVEELAAKIKKPLFEVATDLQILIIDGVVQKDMAERYSLIHKW